MTGREKIAKLVADLRAEANSAKMKLDALSKVIDLKLALADELEATAETRSDIACEIAANHIPDLLLDPKLN